MGGVGHYHLPGNDHFGLLQPLSVYSFQRHVYIWGRKLLNRGVSERFLRVEYGHVFVEKDLAERECDTNAQRIGGYGDA